MSRGLCRTCVAALVISISVLLTACAGQPATPATGGTQNEPAGPRKGGRLIIGKIADPDGYDPHRVTAINAAYVISQVFEGLVALDYDLQSIKPSLAKEWSVSEDGLTYTFKLRDDVLFHSGRQFTSADVKYSFERILDPQTASAHKVRLGNVEALETPDAATFVLKLKTPHSELLLQLANPFLMIVDREAVEKHGAKFGVEFAAGTGPFMWGEWVTNDHVLLKRFDKYRGPSWVKNKGPAYLDEIEYRVIPESQTLMFELESGNIHTIYGLQARDVASLQKNPQLQLLETKPYFHIQFLGLKTSRPNLQDVKVRQALNYAINKEEIVNSVQHGMGSPAENLVAAGTQDYSADAEKLWPKYDPDQAKRLLDEAGWTPGADGIRAKNGQKLELVYYAAQGSEEMATLIQAHLKQVGIDMQIQQMDLTVFFAALRNDDYDLFTLDYAYPSSLDLLNLYFSSKNIPSPNRMAWNDKQTDELLEQARNAPNAESRGKAVAELHKIVAENALWVPLFHRSQLVPVNKAVQDFKPHGIYGQQFFNLVDVWLSDTK